MTTVNSASTSATANLASILRTADAKNAVQPKGADTMGKSDFLKLFTTQLKNQDPTDPVKNEAFVAQMAQFSQLEATTNMSTALTQMAATMQGDRMMSGAGLIGRSVTAAGLPAMLSGGQPVSGTVTLPNGASSVQLDIFDATGKPVRSVVAGSQQPGAPGFTWDGLDNSGNALPDGFYSVVATKSGIDLMKTEVGYRVAFAESLGAGQGVTTYAPKDVAAEETRALVSEMLLWEKTLAPAVAPPAPARRR